VVNASRTASFWASPTLVHSRVRSCVAVPIAFTTAWNVSITPLSHCAQASVQLSPTNVFPSYVNASELLREDYADIGLTLTLLMWTNASAPGEPCVSIEDDAAAPAAGSSTAGVDKQLLARERQCVQLQRTVPLVWRLQADGSLVVSSTFTPDGSVDHYAFVLSSESDSSGKDTVPDTCTCLQCML
jgi:hypothetical protein